MVCSVLSCLGKTRGQTQRLLQTRHMYILLDTGEASSRKVSLQFAGGTDGYLEELDEANPMPREALCLLGAVAPTHPMYREAGIFLARQL